MSTKNNSIKERAHKALQILNYQTNHRCVGHTDVALRGVENCPGAYLVTHSSQMAKLVKKRSSRDILTISMYRLLDSDIHQPIVYDNCVLFQLHHDINKYIESLEAKIKKTKSK